MNPLSNPVVFIALGEACKFLPPLQNALDYYVNGAAFVKIPSQFDELFIKSEAARVWHDFLKSGVGKADIVRLNIFICTENSAFDLPHLLNCAYKNFAQLYPAGVFIDIYCLADDVNLLENDKNEVLDMLNHLEGDGLKVYILSNLTSMNTFAREETTAETVALLTLFKDCVPKLYVTEADASRYNEFYFSQNCATRSGNFFTAGSILLKVPRSALHSLIMAEIFDFGRDAETSENPLPAPAFPVKRPYKTVEYLSGLGVPSFNRRDPLTRRQWINRLFGERLEFIANDYEPAEILDAPAFDDLVESGQFTIFDLQRQTDFHLQAENEALDAATDYLRAEEEKLAGWLEKAPEMGKNDTRKLSPFQTQDMFPYTLASEYLRKLVDIQHIGEKINMLKIRKRKIEKHAKKLQNLKEELQKARQALNFDELNSSFAAFTENKTRDAISYFREIFKDYAAKNAAQIGDLTHDMAQSLLRGEFKAFKKRLENFVELHILTDAAFNRPVTEVLFELIDGEDISVGLSEWVLQQRHLGIRLKTGYAGLYNEANLFMSTEYAAVSDVKKHYEERGLGRMNIFASEGASRVAVLYHAGAFSPDEMYNVVMSNEE
jgi:hypothetical protein